MSDMKKVGAIRAEGKTYGLYMRTGKVLDANTRSQTEVYGGGGGGSGMVHNGTGYVSSAPISISSTTTTHQRLFIEDESGTEHAISTEDFEIVCRPGHVLTFVGAIDEADDAGWQVIAYNHNTRDTKVRENILQNVFGQEAMRKRFRRNIFLGCIGLGVFLGLGEGFDAMFFYGFLGLVGAALIQTFAAGILAAKKSHDRVQAFLSGPDMQGVRREIEAVDLTPFKAAA